VTEPKFVEHAYVIKIPTIGGYKIHFIFSNSVQKSWLKRFNTDAKGVAMLEDAGGTHTQSGGGHSFIILPWNVGVASMVHECWHAVYALLNWAGIPLDNNELIAYMIGWIVSSGQQAQVKNDKKRKVKLQRIKDEEE
jgi:hypothetical protein